MLVMLALCGSVPQRHGRTSRRWSRPSEPLVHALIPLASLVAFLPGEDERWTSRAAQVAARDRSGHSGPLHGRPAHHTGAGWTLRASVVEGRRGQHTQGWQVAVRARRERCCRAGWWGPRSWSGIHPAAGRGTAVVNTVNTATRAVFFAGLTVAIALLGQFVRVRHVVPRRRGCRSDRHRRTDHARLAHPAPCPARLHRSQGVQPQATTTDQPIRAAGRGRLLRPLFRWSRSIERHSAFRAAVSLLVVLVVALPAFSLRLGVDDAGTDPASTTTRQAYDLMAQGFGPGFNGPFELVAAIHGSADQAASPGS